MDLKKKFLIIINDADLKLEEDSVFEKLLKVLVDYGMDEEEAAQMIADCIDEQYELDNIKSQLSSIYQEAKNELQKNDSKKKFDVIKKEIDKLKKINLNY